MAAHLFYSQQAPLSTHLIQSQLNLISSSVLPYSPWMNYVVTAALLVQPSYYRTLPPVRHQLLVSVNYWAPRTEHSVFLHSLQTTRYIIVYWWLHRWTSLLFPNKKLNITSRWACVVKSMSNVTGQWRKKGYLCRTSIFPHRIGGHIITNLVTLLTTIAGTGTFTRGSLL